MVAAPEVWGQRLTRKGHEGDDTVLDTGLGYMSVFICQNLQNGNSRLVQFTVC